MILNEKVLPPFSPERGLRQGDPPSPYVFVLVTEAFSFFIKKSYASGEFARVSIAKEAQIVTHSFFADDSLLFGKVNAKEIEGLRKAIYTFSHVSGQRINFEKSNVVFSSNTKEGDRGSFC